MKRKLIYSTAVAALFSASVVLAGGQEMVIMPKSPFDGFYLGGGVSLHQTGFSIDGSTAFFDNEEFGSSFTNTLATQSGGDTSTDVYGNVRGGWGKVFMNRYYAGIEGFADFGNANGSINNTLLPNAIFTTNLTNSAEVNSTYGVAARLGMLLSPTTLAYAKLGVDWASIKSSVNGTSVSEGLFNPGTTTFADNSSSQTEAAFLWGFGLEQFVWRDVLSVFAEYTHSEFGSVSTTSNLIFPNEEEDEQAGFAFTNSSSADVSAFTGGVNIHFGRDWI